MTHKHASFAKELILYTTNVVVSFLVLVAGLNHLDPNKNSSTKMTKQKAESKKCFHWPQILTNPYEVFIGNPCEEFINI